MLNFKTQIKDTTYFFSVDENLLLTVNKYYNAKGFKYVHQMTEDKTSELARLVVMFKKMPDEMWVESEPEQVENHSPKCNVSGIRRSGLR